MYSCLATFVIASALTGSDAAQSGTEVSFADIAPIVFEKCAVCHQPGQSAPFALTSLDDCVRWAAMIREVLDQNRMPPWHADRRYGRFSNDRSLRPEEKQKLLAWLDAGCLADEDPPRFYARRSEAVRPDLVLETPAFSVPASGLVEYQYITLDPALGRDEWIQAVEIQPGNAAVVHHVNAHLRPRGAPRDKFYENMVGDQCLAIMVPGNTFTVFPSGTAKRLPRDCELLLIMHYVTTGKPETDRTRVVLQFADAASVRQEMATRLLLDPQLRIAANEIVTARNSWRLEEDRVLFALYPHMHLRGRSMQFIARFPDGLEEILLNVPDYDFNWQHRYVLAEPRPLPRGTTLECTAVFDNTADNPRNPDPTQEVRAGQATTDEMFQATFETVVAGQDLQCPHLRPGWLAASALGAFWLALRRRKNRQG